MTIKTTQATYTSRISEESLKEVLEYYWKNKLNQDITITSVKHEETTETQGFGMNEFDITQPNGLTITFGDTYAKV